MNRHGPVLIVGLILLASAACSPGPAASSSTASSATPTSRPSSAPSTSSPAPTPTPAPSVSQCASILSARPAAATTGTVSGPVGNGRILFGIEASGEAGTIALADLDLQGLHFIPIGADRTLAHVTWSPGGVVFDSERAGDRHLFAMGIDGGSVEQLTRTAGTAEQAASLSPDGKQMAYEHYSCRVPQDLGIQIALSDGQQQVALTQTFPVGSPGGEGDASISPDGRSVVFVRFLDAGHSAVFVVPSAGGTARRLTGDEAQVSYPRWSPDGSSIVFTRGMPGGPNGSDLWIVPARGGSARLLTSYASGMSTFSGAWSPDGKQIVFEAYANGWDHNELRTISTNRSNERTIWTGTDSTAESPDWGK